MRKILPLLLLVFVLQACKKQDLKQDDADSENLLTAKTNGLSRSQEAA